MAEPKNKQKTVNHLKEKLALSKKREEELSVEVKALNERCLYLEESIDELACAVGVTTPLQLMDLPRCGGETYADMLVKWIHKNVTVKTNENN